LVKQQEFLSTYIFGAICPARDYGVAIIVPLSNTDGMNLLLKEVSKKVPEGRHAVMVMDKAAWHRSKSLAVPANISIIYLPSYSPELNPTEQVWEYMKQMWLSNCFFEDYEALLSACCNAWNNFIGEVGRIKSLCSREWATL
jgi:transposase